MTSTTKLKKLLDDVDKADHILIRHILKAVIIQSSTWAETTEHALAADTPAIQPLTQHSSDESTQSGTNDNGNPAQKTKVNDGEATLPLARGRCTACGKLFNVAENDRGIKRCVIHPGT